MGVEKDSKSKNKHWDRFARHFADKVQFVIAQQPEMQIP